MRQINRFLNLKIATLPIFPFFLTIVLLTLAVLSCSKNAHFPAAGTGDSNLIQSPALAQVRLFLQDSLSPGAYDSLEFSDMLVDSTATGNLFLRFPSLGDPVTRRFIVVETTPELTPLKAARFLVAQTAVFPALPSTGSSAVKALFLGSSPAFNGTVTKTWLNGGQVYSSAVVNGYTTALHPTKTVGADATDKTTDSDFDGTGETLPDILIQAPYADDEQMMYYMDLGEWIEGGGGTSAYTSSNSGGVSLLGFPVDLATVRPAINLRGYFGCFGALTTAGVTYTLTAYASIPTSDPNAMLYKTVGQAPLGNAFLGLSKTAGGQTTTQYICFYSGCPSCVQGTGQTPSEFADMSGSAYNASYSKNITAAQFAVLENTMLNDASLQYSPYEFNSTDFISQIFNNPQIGAGGLNVVPMEDISGSTISSPNGLYMAIANLAAKATPGASANPSSQGQVGTSHGNCGGGPTSGQSTLTL
ncbi:MAG: hypothetical protein P4L51_06070 [Puia sp.]|nr:hypothetical protein [Puia sp.]